MSSSALSAIGLTLALALVGTIAFYAGKAANSARSERLMTPVATMPLGGAAAGTAMRAPDISQLSPEERAKRLFRRVMLLDSQNKADSVLFFAPMAINAYEMIGTLDADQRNAVEKITAVLDEARRSAGATR